MNDANAAERNLLDEADHRIANHLALLAGYVRLKSGELAKLATEPNRVSVQLLLGGIGVQIEAVSRLHRSLAADHVQTSADLSQHLQELCAAFRSGLFGGVELIEEIEPGVNVRLEQVLPLTQIFAELITNSIKHGHQGREAGTIRVQCRRDANEAVLLGVVDDGTGLSETFDPATNSGLGFRLVRALGEQVGGLAKFEGGHEGLSFHLTLPARVVRADLATEALPIAALQTSDEFREVVLTVDPLPIAIASVRPGPADGSPEGDI